MTRLHRLHTEQRQSPWLDNLTRVYLRDGTLSRFIADGIRGVTANPTIFANSIESSDAYDEQFAVLIAQGRSVEEAYWDLVVDDVSVALGLLRPTYDSSNGADGFVSVEVAPDVAHETAATITAARDLHKRINQPNLFVKIPATGEGVPAIQAMIAEGRNINVTLIFSLARYEQVIDAYLAGLETLSEGGGDLTSVHSVASFFVSRVDVEVDRRLNEIGTPEAHRLLGSAAIAQAKLAFRLSAASSTATVGPGLHRGVRSCSGPSGRRHRPKTPRIPTRCTSTVSSVPIPSTRSQKRRSQRSKTTARSLGRLARVPTRPTS